MKNTVTPWQVPGIKVVRTLLCGLLLLACLPGYSQSRLPIGGWQIHAPYQQGRAVAEADDRVYCASEWGLFYYDKEFNTTETISKVDGLREQHISTIAYDNATQTLVIAYENTNIDLLRGNKVININDILRKATTAEKRINHIAIYNKQAYLSTSFGMVVLDLVKLEIRDTYSNLGPNGELANVRSSTVVRDSLYLATNLGVLGGSTTGTNLQDFRSWKQLAAGLPVATSAVVLTNFRDKVYTTTMGNGLFRLQNQEWQPQPVTQGNAVTYIATSQNKLVGTAAAGVLVLDENGSETFVQHEQLKAPVQAIVGNNNALWVADRAKGLVKIDLAANTATAFAPNGPSSSGTFNVYAANGKVYGLTGGYNASYEQRDFYNGFFVYHNQAWENFNSTIYPDSKDYINIKDVVAALYNPVTGKTYIASYGSGLLEWSGLGKSKLYNGTNSPLLSAAGLNDQVQYVRIPDLAADSEGNVWVVNRNQFANQPGLHVLRPDDTWQSFVLPGVVDGSNLAHIVIDDFNHKWLSIARRASVRNGIVVFDEQNNQVKQLSTGAGTGGLPNGTIYALTKDLNGDIWVGTASGIGIFYNPGAVFSADYLDARVPIIDGRPILEGQLIRAIGVDGANRKWVGTDNGLWVFDADGTEVIKYFSAANSPLPSDKIQSITVEHKSGEVFVATDAGIASYRAGATITEGTPDCATVYPNPVRKDFSGMVGVSGLANNAQVRIVDINGTLVYKGQATGGTLTWDARGYNGRRVRAGVYLVLSSDEEGTNACVSKIAVLD